MSAAGVFRALCGLAAAAALLAVAPAASADAVNFGPNSQQEPFYRWTVPAKVCSATFDLYGAEGSGGVGGARVTTTLTVKPGTLYYLVVGSWGTLGNGGYNGGGDASGNGVGGGGATDVRTGASLADRILVAGGGGGNGGGNPPIAGGGGGPGGLVGTNGDQQAIPGVGIGGVGGSASSGGAGGGGASPGTSGSPGTLGQGGTGGTKPDGNGHGGGGGGGLWGGGGGGAGSIGSGGGGGSSLVGGGTVTTTSGGQGKAILTFNASPDCGEAGGGGQPGGGGGGEPGGGGQPGGGSADRTKPRLRGLTFSRDSFTAARSGASTSADTKRRLRTGTKVSFRLSETGKVKFSVTRKVNGRKRRGRCVEPGRSPRGKPCTRWVAVRGSFSFAAGAGTNTFVFRGRVGGRSLKPGDYRLESKATDNARNVSPIERARFEIVG